ncbi:glucosyltransferase [Serendipita sp. 401]|nr:glucosyltransferase [Serendipita sp. 401]
MAWRNTVSSPLFYVAFCAATVLVLKEVNSVVWEPYMDEPFHVPQAQAYCESKWEVWDPKITTPPGLYMSAVIIRKIFMFKCRLPLLRLVPALHLLSLPLSLHALELYHQRLPSSQDILTTPLSSVVLASFPPLWFFGFLFYTDVPGIAFVLAAFVMQANGSNWMTALLGLWSLFFRQTNIIWILYIFAYHTVRTLRFAQRRPTERSLHDPPALQSSFLDLAHSARSLLYLLPSLFWDFLPYGLLTALFGAFVVWNGGIVLGDKSNHIPALHIPQLFYFYAFVTALGWPALLLSGVGPTAGPIGLSKEVYRRMFGTPTRVMMTIGWTILIMACVQLFTIHHPFILSDNRHYTFYIWKRVLFRHRFIPFLMSPLYLACWWAWWIRVGSVQSMLRTLLLPLALIPTLLPSPLLEPRYFLVPYVFLRLQVPPYEETKEEGNGTKGTLEPDTLLNEISSNPPEGENTVRRPKRVSSGKIAQMHRRGIDWSEYLPWIELVWYTAINGITMYVFLYKDRTVDTIHGEEVIRFMW